MINSSKRYTEYERELLRNLVKVGAQNGIPQKILAEQIAPVLRRKASAIETQMNIARNQWVKQLQSEMSMAYNRARVEGDFLTENETEMAQPEETVQDEPELPVQTPVLQPLPKKPVIEKPKNEPLDGEEIEVVVTIIKDFGAIVRATNYDVHGLLHISNISDAYVTDPKQWLKINQHINVVVTRRQNGSYEFSAKDAKNSGVQLLV